MGEAYQYRGHARWIGPCFEPNTFGVLMGAGAVLAVGLLVRSPKSNVQSPSHAEGGGRSLKSQVQSPVSAKCGVQSAKAEHPTSNIQHPTSKLVGWLKAAFFLAAAGRDGGGVG